jgi:hypothetical protein
MKPSVFILIGLLLGFGLNSVLRKPGPIQSDSSANSSSTSTKQELAKESSARPSAPLPTVSASNIQAGKTDLAGRIDAIFENPNRQMMGYKLYGLLHSIPASDFTLALNHIKEKSEATPKHRWMFLQALTIISDKDPATAMDFANGIKSKQEREQGIQSVMIRMVFVRSANRHRMVWPD